jgi:hypothetical protein
MQCKLWMALMERPLARGEHHGTAVIRWSGSFIKTLYLVHVCCPATGSSKWKCPLNINLPGIFCIR